MIADEPRTGKDLVAESIHKNSGRTAAWPFSRVDCETLSEAEGQIGFYGAEKIGSTGRNSWVD
jgi:transcriptional regulator with AAA-type ATPase domain